jgi:DNA-binding PadR family transcriptional regulator
MDEQPTFPVGTNQPALSVPEWLVLAVLTQQARHGFAVAQLTAPDGEIGRVWHIPKAVIYRAIGRLLDIGLIEPEGTEPGLGPQRTVYAAVPAGQSAARRWLRTPVDHVRDIRSQLLLKLALLDRAGEDPADLLRMQRQVLEPIARAMQAKSDGAGFDATLIAWRKATALAALDFIDAITDSAPAGRRQPLRTNVLPHQSRDHESNYYDVNNSSHTTKKTSGSWSRPAKIKVSDPGQLRTASAKKRSAASS